MQQSVAFHQSMTRPPASGLHLAFLTFVLFPMLLWGGGGGVRAEIHVAAEEIAGASCHHAAKRTSNHLYLARQLSEV
jgi:hypothetical protein